MAAARDGARDVPALLLPVAVGRMRLLAGGRPAASHVPLRAAGDGGDGGDAFAGDVHLYDADGALVGWLDDVRLARVPITSRLALAADGWHHELRWEPTTLAAACAEATRWIVIGERGGVAAAVRDALVARGASASIVACDDAAIGEAIAIADAPVHVVHLSGLDAPALEASAPDDVVALTATAYATASTALAALGGNGSPVRGRLSIVTRRARRHGRGRARRAARGATVGHRANDEPRGAGSIRAARRSRCRRVSGDRRDRDRRRVARRRR